jgi:HK97 family phage portal protein
MSAKPSILERIKAGLGGFVRGFDTAGWLRGDDTDRGGSSAITDPLEQSEIIYACISTLASNVANLPLAICQGDRQGGERVIDGPAWALFSQPHPEVSRFDFWELVVTWLMLRGRCYVVGLDSAGNPVSLRNRLRKTAAPVQLVILNADRLSLIKFGNILSGYRYSASSGDFIAPRNFTPEQVLALRLPNPFDRWEGTPPASVALLAAQTDRVAALFMRGLMENNADQGVIVTTEQMLQDDQVKQLDGLLRARKRRAGTADKPLILFGGLKVEKPAIAAADAMFLENRQMNRRQICAVFGVPESLLGFNGDANRSTSESDRLSFLECRILPFGERLAAGILPVLRCFGDDLDCFFDAEQSPAMQSARRGRFTGAAIAVTQMGVPLNVANRVFDLGLPGDLPGAGDVLRPFSLESVGTYAPPAPARSLRNPQSELRNLPEGLQALAKLLSAPSVTAAQKPPAGSEAKSQGPQDPVTSSPSGRDGDANTGPDTSARAAASPDGAGGRDEGRAKAPAEPASENPTAPQERSPYQAKPHICSSPAAYSASIQGSIKAKTGRMKRFFFEQRGRVLSRLESALRNQKSEIPTLSRGLEELFPFAEEDAALLKLLKPALLTDVGLGGAQLWAEIGAAGSFQLSPAGATEFLAARASAIRGINETTWSALRGELTEGIEAGESYAELAARVREVYTDADQRRAETIAQTETNIAVNSGRFAGMEQAGVERKGWLSSDLETTRETHHEAGRRYGTEETAIPLDDTFLVGGEQMMFPGDPSASAGNVINCRCTSFAVIADPGPEAASAGGAALPRSRTFRMCLPTRFLTYEEHTAKTRTNAPGRNPGSGDSTAPAKPAP